MAEIIKLDGTQQLDFDRATVEQAYDRWAPIYDIVFGGVFSKGRRAAIAATNRIGGRVLEVGVGTGLGLSIVARIAELHGARVSLDEGAAGGLRVRVEFPDPGNR